MQYIFTGTLVFFAILGPSGAKNRQRFLERQKKLARVTHELGLMAELTPRDVAVGAVKSSTGKKFMRQNLLESIAWNNNRRGPQFQKGRTEKEGAKYKDVLLKYINMPTQI